MKILGFGKKNTEKTIMIEITQRELEKLLGTYYASNIPGKNISVYKLEPEDEIDIEKIYSMTQNLFDVQRQMIDTITAFKNAQNTLLSFAELTLNVKGEAK